MASSKKSAKSKTERKLEKEIEKMKGNYGTMKNAIDVRLNDQNEFIDEMAHMKELSSILFLSIKFRKLKKFIISKQKFSSSLNRMPLTRSNQRSKAITRKSAPSWRN